MLCSKAQQSPRCELCARESAGFSALHWDAARRPGLVNWARGTKGTWKLEQAMNPPLSSFSKQDSDPLLKNLFCPCVPYKETGNFRGKKGPVSYTVAQGGWGHRGCRQEAGVAPAQTQTGEPLPPFDCSQRSPGSRGKLSFLGNKIMGSLSIAALNVFMALRASYQLNTDCFLFFLIKICFD